VAGRPVWLAARLVCWLVGWLGGLVVLTSLPSAISLLVSCDASFSLSLSLSLSLSICLCFTLFLLQFFLPILFHSFSYAFFPTLVWLKIVVVVEPKKWPCKLPLRTMATLQLLAIPLFSEMQPGASRLPSTSRCGYLKLDARNFAAFVTIDDAELSSVCWRSLILRKVRGVRLSLEHWLTKLLSRPRLARKKNWENYSSLASSDCKPSNVRSVLLLMLISNFVQRVLLTGLYYDREIHSVIKAYNLSFTNCV